MPASAPRSRATSSSPNGLHNRAFGRRSSHSRDKRPPSYKIATAGAQKRQCNGSAQGFRSGRAKMRNQPEVSRRMLYFGRIAGAATLALCLSTATRAQQEQQSQGQEQGQHQQ